MGNDHDVLGIENASYAFIGLLNEALSSTQEIKKLFGGLFCGHGPKSAPNSTGHDDAVRCAHVQSV